MTVKMGRFECIKYLMVTFNILISLSGCLLLATALLLLLHPTGLRHFVSVSALLFIGTVYSLSLSFVLLILGILGIIAVFRQSRNLLLLFFLLILLVFIVELTAGILAFVFRNQLTKKYFEDNLIEYYTGDNAKDTYSSNCNSIMISFECCGVIGPQDFLHTINFIILNPTSKVPEACCKRGQAMLDGDILDRNKCLSGDVEFIHTQICVMIFSIWLAQQI
ncbi:tetraspanin-18-like isoform X2 [Heptranchias perlo]|uniref:tetraspanin-18-like isoform X2 n=1 Tax=Heptranchias perlo TaxID=212740 RepID=UPI0035595ADA